MATTGTYPIRQSVLIDQELRCQRGVSLREWAQSHGVPQTALISAIDGYTHGLEEVLVELAEALGVTLTVLCGGRRPAAVSMLPTG